MCWFDNMLGGGTLELSSFCRIVALFIEKCLDMHQNIVRVIFAYAATQKHPGRQAEALLIYTEVHVIKTTREAVTGLWEEERETKHTHYIKLELACNCVK